MRFPGTTACFFPLLAAALFLASCNSSSAPAVDAGVNQHLVQQAATDADAVYKPHQTVVLNLSPAIDDHGGGEGYHELPYRIESRGNYRFCVPEDDLHLSRVELHAASGALAASWSKGEPCSGVDLEPGNYSMHVHLESGQSEPLIFLKPHDVEVTQTGVSKGAGKRLAALSGAVPLNQFLNVKVDTLSEVLFRNDAGGMRQGWAVTAAAAAGDLFYELRAPNIAVSTNGVKVAQGSNLQQVAAPGLSDLFYLTPGPDGTVSLSQGESETVSYQNVCLESHIESRPICSGDEDCINGGYHDVTVCGEYGTLLGTLYAGAGGYRKNFSFTPNGLAFRLGENGGTVNWYANRWSADAGTTAVSFKVAARYGTTSGLNVPALMANEVALFDQPFGVTGFPEGTRYWIVSGSMKDFSGLSFDNPTNRVKSVLCGRAARAQIFENPAYSGQSAYVSPPADSEMIATGTDHALLAAGTVGSIRIEPNSNDIPVNEYAYHIVVSAKRCVGCDLRGFNASYAKSLDGVDFSNSDLSNANLSLNRGAGGTISRSNFSNANMSGADFSKDTFELCNFTGTDFDRAVFRGATSKSDQRPAGAQIFYNSCPRLDNTDLTSFSDSDLKSLDSVFPVATGYNATTWWRGDMGPLCRTSIANAKVNQRLFRDKRLWQFVDAPGVDFSGMNLDGAVFAGSNLAKASFRNASLKGAVFVKANLTGADLTGADLSDAHLEGANLDGVDLGKVKTLTRAYLAGVTLQAPNLAGLDLSGARLAGSAYVNWDGHRFETTQPASIIGAYMYNTKLNGADLSGAHLENVSWFGPDATGEGATMVGTHFEFADLPGLNLKMTHLQGANFSNAVLVNAQFSTRSSTDYSFRDTNFYRANLKGAKLDGANLNGASLAQAHVYTGTAEQVATVEVLDDPARNPNRYKYLQVSYTSTVPPASTTGILACPSGTRSPAVDCGELASGYWLSAGPVLEPSDCYLRAPLPGEVPNDEGKVLVCTSHRHPVTP